MLAIYGQAAGEIEMYIDYCNEVRLHSATGYVTPRVRLEGRQEQVFAERERKLEEARRKRRQRFADVGNNTRSTSSDEAETGSVGAQPVKE